MPTASKQSKAVAGPVGRRCSVQPAKRAQICIARAQTSEEGSIQTRAAFLASAAASLVLAFGGAVDVQPAVAVPTPFTSEGSVFDPPKLSKDEITKKEGNDRQKSTDDQSENKRVKDENPNSPINKIDGLNGTAVGVAQRLTTRVAPSYQVADADVVDTAKNVAKDAAGSLKSATQSGIFGATDAAKDNARNAGDKSGLPFQPPGVGKEGAGANAARSAAQTVDKAFNDVPTMSTAPLPKQTPIVRPAETRTVAAYQVADASIVDAAQNVASNVADNASGAVKEAAGDVAGNLKSATVNGIFGASDAAVDNARSAATKSNLPFQPPGTGKEGAGAEAARDAAGAVNKAFADVPTMAQGLAPVPTSSL